MYHNTYPASWFISNQLPKTPLLFTYGDVPFFAVDHLTAFMPLPQQPLYATSQITLDVPNMKRIPVNALMQSVETLNNYLPLLRRRNISQAVLDRQFSKESLTESTYGDSGVSSSRSSTPSSVETSTSDSRSVPVYKPFDGGIHQKRNSNRNSQNHNSKKMHQNQRHFRQNPKNLNTAIPMKKLPYNVKDEWNSVSIGIWDHYIKNRQKDDMYIKKMNLRTAVHSLLVKMFPNCGLRVVGSSVNGLGTNSSDADMCLILSAREIDQQTEAMDLLRYAQLMLCQCSFIKSTDLITAKVPILKFTDKFNNIQVDLNINNTVGISNTQLLAAYSKGALISVASHHLQSFICLATGIMVITSPETADWRVPPLVLVIKKWAQDCKINNAKEMTLSSYSLVLMVVHYLQCGCDPPVLPCIQRMQPRHYDSGDYWKWLVPQAENINFHSRNTESLGSLLYGFFDYYTNRFDFAKDVISIRLGCKLPKHVAMSFTSSKNKRGHWKFICIEEPFNRTNTACAVYDQDSFNRIISAFKSTWLTLSNKKDLSAVLSS